MIVVSDSSVLIHLAAIGHLELLKVKFGEVIVPKAVWREVVVDGEGRPGADEVRQASWIKMHEVHSRPLVITLTQHLDDGESEAIALAVEAEADLVLLDERDARNAAEALGLDILGVIGILIWAKRENLIQSLKDAIVQLRQITGFRLSDRLYTTVLAAAGEDG